MKEKECGSNYIAATGTVIKMSCLSCATVGAATRGFDQAFECCLNCSVAHAWTLPRNRKPVAASTRVLLIPRIQHECPSPCDANGADTSELSKFEWGTSILLLPA